MKKRSKRFKSLIKDAGIGKKFNTKEVFDLDSYKQDKLILRGHIEEGPNGKVIFDKI